jgi:hypothetical protein
MVTNLGLKPRGAALEYIKDLKKHNFIKAYEEPFDGNELFYIMCNVENGLFVTLSTTNRQSEIDSGDTFGEMLIPDKSDKARFNKFCKFWFGGGNHFISKEGTVDMFMLNLLRFYPPKIVSDIKSLGLTLLSPWWEPHASIRFMTPSEVSMGGNRTTNRTFSSWSDFSSFTTGEKIMTFPDAAKKIILAGLALS